MERTLEPERLVQTREGLVRRIGVRFPLAGSSRVCGELPAVGRRARERAAEPARKAWQKILILHQDAARSRS